MKEFVEATTPSPLLPPHFIAKLYLASLKCGDAAAKLVTIACLGPWDAALIGRTPIGNLDRIAGTLRIDHSPASARTVVLGFEAAAVLDVIIRDGRVGPILIGPNRNVLEDDAATGLRLQEALGEVDAGTLAFDWSLRLIRESIFAEMVDGGIPLHVAAAQAGLGPFDGASALTAEFRLEQRGAAEWWAYRLGVEPPPAYLLIEAAGRTSFPSE